MIRGTEIQMMMWIELMYIATSFVVRNPNIVLDDRWRWRPLVHLRVFVRCCAKRVSSAQSAIRDAE
jgi:hypothetical protein